MSKACSCTFALLPLAILIGLGIGHFFPEYGTMLGTASDPIVLLLLTLVFFEARFEPEFKTSDHLGFLSLAWVANFVLIPILAWSISSLFFGNQPALRIGLLLYFLFPCTDWFLAFTRMSKGDVSLGSVLIPINLVSQLLLFPLYLALFAFLQPSLFTGFQANLDLIGISWTIGKWFLFPFFAAILTRLLFSRLWSAERNEALRGCVGTAVPWVLATLVLCIFSSNASELTKHPSAFPLILFAVFLFFLLTWLCGEFLGSRFRLTHSRKALLAITMTARNSPLMLGLATVAFPNQPLIYAALIIGMLVEFPHLTILSRLMSQKAERTESAPGKLVTNE